MLATVNTIQLRVAVGSTRGLNWPLNQRGVAVCTKQSDMASLPRTHTGVCDAVCRQRWRHLIVPTHRLDCKWNPRFDTREYIICSAVFQNSN